MATAVIMPKQGQSVETCIITRWFKSKGESVSAGDILFSYETDKAAFDLESPSDGIILDIYFNEGSEVPVLSNVAVIGKSGEPTDSFDQGHSYISAPPAPPAPETGSVGITPGIGGVRVAPRGSSTSGSTVNIENSPLRPATMPSGLIFTSVSVPLSCSP